MNQLSTISQTETNNCFGPRKIYIKRKKIAEEPIMFETSIFEESHIKPIQDMVLLEELKQFQTLTTADNNITLNTNPEEAVSLMFKSQTPEKSQLFPKLKFNLQSKLPSKSTINKSKQKSVSLKNCPYYVQLQETAAKRVQNKYKRYKRAWLDSCFRKQQSLIQRSLNRAALSIQNINKDAHKRKNTSQLSLILRNNIAQKTFIFPGQLKPQIEGLKGKGGKVIPIFSELYMVQQVYKHNKKTSIVSD